VEATTDDAQRQRELRRQGIADAEARATEKTVGRLESLQLQKWGLSCHFFGQFLKQKHCCVINFFILVRAGKMSHEIYVTYFA